MEYDHSRKLGGVMFSIGKVFTFDAAHRLSYLGPRHKCSQLHGHTYKVEVVLSSEDLDERGFVIDFWELDRAKEYITNRFDHQFLNDFMEKPTAECIAGHLFQVFSQWYPALKAVRVWETATCWAEVSR